MSRRVVITGLGAITPIGNSVDDFYAGIKEGRIGLDNISKFDTSDFRVKIAAEVKDFAPENYMDKKAARRMEPFCQYAVAAAGEAIKDSGLDIEKEDPFMVGCAISSGVGILSSCSWADKETWDTNKIDITARIIDLKPKIFIDL